MDSFYFDKMHMLYNQNKSCVKSYQKHCFKKPIFKHCELISTSATKANIHHIIYNGVCTPCEAYTYGKMIMSGKAVVKKGFYFKANYTM